MSNQHQRHQGVEVLLPFALLAITAALFLFSLLTPFITGLLLISACAFLLYFSITALLQRRQQVVDTTRVPLSDLSTIHLAENAIYKLGPDYRITAWNKAAETLYGYSAAEAVGQLSNKLLETDASADTLCAYLEHAKRNEYWLGELKRKTKDGRMVFVNASVTVLRNQKGSITGYITVNKDITDKTILQEQIAYAAKFIDQSDDAVATVATDGTVLSWNKGAENMYGYTAAEMIGKKSFGMLKGAQFEKDQSILEALREGRPVRNYETVRYNKQGAALDVSMTISPVKNAGGQVIGISGIARDVTARKKATALAQLLSARLQTILNNVPAGIALLDETGLMIDCNNVWQRAAGKNCLQGNDYLPGSNYKTMLAADAPRGAVAAEGIRAVLNKERADFEMEYVCHDHETERWYRMTVTPCYHTTLNGVVVMHDDITDLRQAHQSSLAEQQKINKMVLQAQEQERNQLGRDLHDNLCQLLVVLKMKLDFLDGRQPQKDLLKECVAFLDEAIAETRDISHRMIIPRFADSSFSGALIQLAATYNLPNRSVVVDYGLVDEQVMSIGIREALYRISQESLNNMHKYANAQHVCISLSATDEDINMIISDDGIGFDPTQNKNGAGLKNIITRAEAFNGHAHIDTSPGNGCTLYISMPAITKAAGGSV